MWLQRPAVGEDVVDDWADPSAIGHTDDVMGPPHGRK